MLEGKVAVITGATRGIGFATARLFLENKAKVVICGRCEEGINKAIDLLKKENSEYEVCGFYPKLHDTNEVKELFSKVKEKYGKIDILINNAGISSKTSLIDYTEEEYDNIANLNIKAVFTCSKEIVPYLWKMRNIHLTT